VQDVVGDGEPVAESFQLQDRDARLEVGRLHVHDQAAPEPAPEALLDPSEFLRWPVAGDHDLPFVLMEVVEGVEELRLRLLGAGERTARRRAGGRRHRGTGAGTDSPGAPGPP